MGDYGGARFPTWQPLSAPQEEAADLGRDIEAPRVAAQTFDPPGARYASPGSPGFLLAASTIAATHSSTAAHSLALGVSRTPAPASSRPSNSTSPAGNGSMRSCCSRRACPSLARMAPSLRLSLKSLVLGPAPSWRCFMRHSLRGAGWVGATRPSLHSSWSRPSGSHPGDFWRSNAGTASSGARCSLRLTGRRRAGLIHAHSDRDDALLRRRARANPLSSSCCSSRRIIAP
jgi:hypothetical protein